MLTVFTSCIKVMPLDVQNVSCCDLKMAGQDEAELILKIRLQNPNTFPIEIKNYDLDIQINGNTVGNGTNKEAIIIGANETMERSVSIKTSAKELISGSLMMGLSSLLGRTPQRLEVEIVGHVTASAKGFSKRVRIKETYPIDLRQ